MKPICLLGVQGLDCSGVWQWRIEWDVEFRKRIAGFVNGVEKGIIYASVEELAVTAEEAEERGDLQTVERARGAIVGIRRDLERGRGRS